MGARRRAVRRSPAPRGRAREPRLGARGWRDRSRRLARARRAGSRGAHRGRGGALRVTGETVAASRRSGRRLATRLRPEVWGLFDQGLVSGVNFLTMILLARTLPVEDFGYFVIAFTLL